MPFQTPLIKSLPTLKKSDTLFLTAGTHIKSNQLMLLYIRAKALYRPTISIAISSAAAISSFGAFSIIASTKSIMISGTLLISSGNDSINPWQAL